MTDREIELQLRIMSRKVFNEPLRIFRTKRKHGLYGYIRCTKRVCDDDLHEMLRVVDFIDLTLGFDGDMVRAYIYERGISIENRLVILLDVEVEDVRERMRLIARLQENNRNWVSFKP